MQRVDDEKETSSHELLSLLDVFQSNDNAIVGNLVKLLRHIAITGSHNGYPWIGVRKLISVHLDTVLSELVAQSSRPADLDGETYEVRLTRIQSLLKTWPRAPFTLQRICELLTEHRRFYRTAAKFLLAFSKLVCGISARAEADEDSEMQSPPPSFFGFGGSSSSMDVGEDKSTMDGLLAPATIIGPSSAFPRDTMDMMTRAPITAGPSSSNGTLSFAPVTIVSAPAVSSPFDAAAAAATSAAAASSNTSSSSTDNTAPPAFPFAADTSSSSSSDVNHTKQHSRAPSDPSTVFGTTSAVTPVTDDTATAAAATAPSSSPTITTGNSDGDKAMDVTE